MMNLESYQVLCELEDYINIEHGALYGVSFTCPGEFFRFEVYSKQDCCAVVYFRWWNRCRPEHLRNCARVIKAGFKEQEVEG